MSVSPLHITSMVVTSIVFGNMGEGGGCSTFPGPQGPGHRSSRYIKVVFAVGNFLHYISHIFCCHFFPRLQICCIFSSFNLPTVLASRDSLQFFSLRWEISYIMFHTFFLTFFSLAWKFVAFFSYFANCSRVSRFVTFYFITGDFYRFY